MSKRGILIVALLMLVLPASCLGASLWNADYTDLNFEDNEWYSSSWKQNETSTFFAISGKGHIKENTVFLKIAVDVASPDAEFSITCYDGNDTEIDYPASAYYFMDYFPTWLSSPYYYVMPLTFSTNFYTGGANTTSYFVYCNTTFWNINSSATMTLYTSPETYLLPSFYRSPSGALEDIVGSTDEIVNASFDIFDLMLIITVMMGLGFIIVLSWKILVYIVNSIKRE